MRFVAAGLLLAWSVSASASPPVPVVATVTASGEEASFPAWSLVAHDDSKLWCVPNGVGASITVTFDRPIAIHGVALLTMYERTKYSQPEKFQLVTDTRTYDAAIQTSADFGDVRLDGAPTKKLTMKILSVYPANVARMCVRELAVNDAGGNHYGVLLGVTPQAAAALPGFAHGLDTALHTCDAKALASALVFPLQVTTSFTSPPSMDQAPRDPVTTKYASAAELAAACAKDGSLLPLGYAGGSVDTSLDEDLLRVRTPGPGAAQLGSFQSGWNLVWNTGWRVKEIALEDPVSALALADGSLLTQWFAAGFAPAADAFVADPTIVVLDAKRTTVAPKDVAGALGGAKPGKTVIDTQTMSRDGQSLWLAVTSKSGKRELRGSALAVKTDAGWRILGALLSDARANDAVNKAAAAGKAPALAPLPALTGDKDLLAAVASLATGPIDAVAAARKDLLALGSGPGEKTVGGAKLAGPWKAAWANKVTFGGGIARVAPSGRTAFVVVDATLAKGTYKIPFRLGLVFDRAASGAWSLAHLQFATP